VGEELGVPVGVVEVGDGGVDVAGAAGFEVSALRATRKRLAPCEAQMRQVASAMPEVAPRTRIFLGVMLCELVLIYLICPV